MSSNLTLSAIVPPEAGKANYMKAVAIQMIAFLTLIADVSASADEIAEQLKVMLAQDQEIRRELGAYQPGSPKWKGLAVKMARIDSENLVRLEEIIAEHGWPSAPRFDAQSSKAAFLIIQHAELPHQKKYLPLVREAVANGGLMKSDLALLEDRILMREGNDQIYGSQLIQSEDGSLKVWPIQNEEEVDLRRAEAGLEPLSKYLERFGLTYTRTSEGGADQPATALKAKPEGKVKPKPDSEEGSE